MLDGEFDVLDGEPGAETEQHRTDVASRPQRTLRRISRRRALYSPAMSTNS